MLPFLYGWCLHGQGKLAPFVLIRDFSLNFNIVFWPIVNEKKKEKFRQRSIALRRVSVVLSLCGIILCKYGASFKYITLSFDFICFENEQSLIETSILTLFINKVGIGGLLWRDKRTVAHNVSTLTQANLTVIQSNYLSLFILGLAVLLLILAMVGCCTSRRLEKG